MTNCPSALLEALNLKWMRIGDNIKAHGIVNGAWVSLTIDNEADQSSSGFFGSSVKDDPAYRRLTVRITTAPTLYTNSFQSGMVFNFRDYANSSCPTPVRMTKGVWSTNFNQDIFRDTVKYVEWFTTAGYD